MTISVPRPIIHAQLAHSTVQADNRTVEATFYSGAEVPRWSWDRGQYMLSFDMSAGAADLSRLNAGAPVLDSHRSNGTEAVVGVVEKASLEKGTGVAQLRFGRDDLQIDRLWNKIAQGLVRGVSMGVELLEMREQTKPGDTVKSFLATKWRPFELSIVAVPADGDAHIHMAAEGREKQEVTVMEQAEMTKLREAADMRQIGKIAGLAADVVERHILAGAPLEQFRRIALDHMAAESEKNPTRTSSIDVLGSGDDSFVPRAAEALACRYTGAAPSDGAREFMGASPVKLAEHCIRQSGRRVPWTAGQTIREALSLGGLHGRSDFPTLLEDFGRRMLAAAYAAASPQIKRVARRSTAADFRVKTIARLGEMPRLIEVNEHGEVTRGSRAEAKESYRLRTYARIFGLTRQALVNDDLGAFADAARAWGASAATLEGELLSALLESNPTMDDTLALFHTDHGNLDTAATGLDVDNLGAARLLMRKATGLDGSTILDITPKYLVVPAELETAGQKALTQIMATQVSDANPFGGALELVVDPRLSDGSFYLFADPGGPFSVLEFCYLDGAEGLQTEAREGFDVEGVELKARLDYGVGATGFRGAVRMEIVPSEE